MKQELYYEDATIQQFTAAITNIGQQDDGRHYIVLDQTAFYPTGGGQPHDTGTIAHFEVIDVEKVDNEIRHYINKAATAIEGPVQCQINWERRFDHMQQHAGQHILTAAFVELFDYPTVSFHLGTDTVTIDLQTEAVTSQQLQQAEALANQIILENLPIETKWVTSEELVHYPLRKEIAVEGDIRLVIIPNFDYNGCGGTHPTSTGQVSAIKIMDTEKMKKNIRVHFVCGQRILKQLHMRKNILSSVAKQLNVPEIEADEALTKVLANQKRLEKLLIEAQDELLKVEVEQLASNNLIKVAYEDRPIQTLQKLARMITAANNKATVILAALNSDKLQLVVSCGEQSGASAKAIASSAFPLINGKGGGNDQLAQGGGEPLLSAEALLDKLVEAM